MKRLFTYLGITFVITYSLEFLLMANVDNLTLMGAGSMVQMLVALFMFVPAIAVVITTLIFRDKFSELPMRPRFKGHIKYYVAAWFAPAVLTALGAALYFLVFPQNFDPSMGEMRAALEAQMAGTGQTMTDSLIWVVLGSQLFGAITWAPLFNGILGFGEELGWRGYMMPKLCQLMKPRAAMLVGGVIWGLWHAPLTAMGHNYGLDYPGFPWLGILAMCCFCIVIGICLTWLTFKTGSVIPAALAHGALNAIAAGGVFFVKGDYSPFIGPTSVGLLGGFGFIVVAAIIFIRMDRLPCKFSAGESLPPETA